MKHRKLFPSTGNDTGDCFFNCDPGCPSYYCIPYPDVYFPPPPPPPPPAKHSVSPYLIVFICLAVSFFIFIFFYAAVAKARGSENNGPEQPSADEEFLDENRVDHPIWFITTAGLQQSIINSITVCKYKKGEGLIEGTECSVCLNEFQEDETVRLLPKCNHAFHVSCIDTWLRSHINCPMCRAYIVSDTATSPLVSADQNSGDSNLILDAHTENSEIDCELGETQERIGESSWEDRAVTEEGEILQVGAERILKDSENYNGNGVSQVLDNSGDDIQVIQNDIQPLGRSVSLDSSLAETICIGLADFWAIESGDCSIGQTIDTEKSQSGILWKPDCAYSSKSKEAGSSSIVQCLHKGPVSMKRSFSCSGRFLSSRRNRNLNAILPL